MQFYFWMNFCSLGGNALIYNALPLVVCGRDSFW